MIIIVTSTNDLSPHEVCDWIIFNHKEYKIINENSKIEIDSIDFINEEIFLSIDSKVLSLCEIESIWYRQHKLKTDYNQLSRSKNELIQFQINQFMKLENDVISEFVNFYLEKTAKYLCLNNKIYVNKLIQLKVAKDVGLKIPTTLIVRNKKDIARFKEKKLITKGIFETFKYADYYYFCRSGTELINKENLLNLENDSFAPSLFQPNIKKALEIRAFFLNGEIYAMAIFSQSNDKTKVDFRNYDLEKPNRMVPYKLPSMTNSYGNIKDVLISDVVKRSEFMSVWNINKDKIDVCMDCEFRHMCTDCRCFIKLTTGIYSQPGKCGYNPYIAKWSKEDGYISVEEWRALNLDWEMNSHRKQMGNAN